MRSFVTEFTVPVGDCPGAQKKCFGFVFAVSDLAAECAKAEDDCERCDDGEQQERAARNWTMRCH